MDEQQVATGASKCPHPEAVGTRWGDAISDERKVELGALADRQKKEWAEQPESTRGKSLFQGITLTGADVSWLAERSGRVPIFQVVPNLHLEGADLCGAHLEGANLRGAHLEGADLSVVRSEGADLRRARLEWVAGLRGAHLKGADLSVADMERADLTVAHLEGADLSSAHLEGADLSSAHLKVANLRNARLKEADLSNADLEGADLSNAHLEGAVLRSCQFDSKTDFFGPRLDHETRLGDIHWSGVGAVDLTRINWDNVPTLGDERDVGLLSDVDIHYTVVRAYRQLAAQLRAQGMNEVADRFLYRAQTRQRWAHLSNLLHDWFRPWRWPGDLARYLGSLFLAVLAGYGYRPGRTLFWYIFTILSFLGGYWLVTHGVPLFGLSEPAGTQPLHWYEALVLSLASFHGRGFFPTGIKLGDPVAILAASEAVFGLFIELSFIATFTQRYFGAK